MHDYCGRRPPTNSGHRSRALSPRQSFGQFDARAGRIENEGDLQADLRHFAEGRIEGDAIRLQFLAEGL